MDDVDTFLEVLHIHESSSQPWPIGFYNPLTGAAVWSYKGAELNNETPQDSVVVGGEYLLIPVSRKPVSILVGLESKNRTIQRSFLSSAIHSLAASSDGAVVCGSCNENLHTWLLSNGKLCSIVSGHYQAITKIAFSTDNYYVVTAGKDGLIFVWNIGDLLTPHDSSLTGTKVNPVHKWTAHSLAVTDVKVGFGGVSGRAYSVSLDQTAKIHCLSSGNLLMTLFFDCPLTSCAIDNAETRLYVGTTKGDIRQTDLFVEPILRERHVDFSMDSDEKLFKGHKQAVGYLSINLDGTLIASASDDCEVKIWHIYSRQCVRTITCKGVPKKALFMPKLASLFNTDYVPSIPVQPLAKAVSTNVDSDVVIRLNSNKSADYAISIDQLMENLLDEERLTDFKTTLFTSNEKDLSYDAEYLRRELAKTKLVNKRLYELCITKIVK